VTDSSRREDVAELYGSIRWVAPLSGGLPIIAEYSVSAKKGEGGGVWGGGGLGGGG